ncbi:MAG: helix-turn-helix domain-containing protein [Alphaproteobacteria bacterium]|nr:helix-turn-helix domain-containing protein [Alphaproteobacteria bacterium]
MTRSSKQVSVRQLSFDMTSTNSPSQQNEENSAEHFAEVSAASEALAKASEALDELRGLAAKVEVDGLVVDAAHLQKAGDGQINEITAPSVEEAPPEKPAELLSEVLQSKTDEIKKAATVQPVAAKQKVGEVLRAAREAAGYAIEDIAAEVKIKPQHLLAIEESRFNDLPARTYAVGFVRAYAGTLGLDVDALVAETRREVSQYMPQRQHQMIMPEAVSEQPLPSSSLVVITAALAFLLSAAGYVFTRDTSVTAPTQPPAISAQHKPAAPVAAAPPPAVQQQVVQPPVQTQQVQPQMQQQVQQPAAVPQPVVQAVPHEEPASVDTADVDTTHVSSGFLQKGLVAPATPTGPGKAAPPSRIKLKAVEETTVQIFDASGRMVAERVINKGEAFYVPDKAGLTLATTNAGALHMQIDGREMQPLGDPDEAMHNIPLNPDSLLKYLQ